MARKVRNPGTEPTPDDVGSQRSKHLENYLRSKGSAELAGRPHTAVPFCRTPPLCPRPCPHSELRKPHRCHSQNLAWPVTFVLQCGPSPDNCHLPAPGPEAQAYLGPSFRPRSTLDTQVIRKTGWWWAVLPAEGHAAQTTWDPGPGLSTGPDTPQSLRGWSLGLSGGSATCFSSEPLLGPLLKFFSLLRKFLKTSPRKTSKSKRTWKKFELR